MSPLCIIKEQVSNLIRSLQHLRPLVNIWMKLEIVGSLMIKSHPRILFMQPITSHWRII